MSSTDSETSAPQVARKLETTSRPDIHIADMVTNTTKHITTQHLAWNTHLHYALCTTHRLSSDSSFPFCYKLSAARKHPPKKLKPGRITNHSATKSKVQANINRQQRKRNNSQILRNVILNTMKATEKNKSFFI